MKFPIAVLISGRGSNLEALAQSIVKHQLPIEIRVVVSDQEHARGLEVAKRFAIPTVVVPRRAKEQTNAEFNLSLVSALKTHQPKLVVLAGFMRVLTAEFIAAFPRSIINIHPSLLPAFRGLDAQAQALAAGVKFAGCSVHLVEPEVDAGPILAQAVVPVLADDDVERLSARILSEEHRLLPAVVAAIARAKLQLDAPGASLKVKISRELIPSPPLPAHSIKPLD